MRTSVAMLVAMSTVTIASGHGTWTPQNGQCPWHDRVGRYVVGELPDKYVSDKPVPQQACSEPRRLVLPAEGAKEVTIAVASAQAGDFGRQLGLESTGDCLELLSPDGRKVGIRYDILIYRDPPRVTEFEGATAGIILLSWDGPGDATATSALAAEAGTYTPAERAFPWHDRMAGQGQWVMVDVPAAIARGQRVPRQSCTNKGLVMPSEGLEAAMVGISDSDIEKLPDALRTQFEDTGADFGIQAPGGGRKLAYSIFVYRKPPKQTELTGLGAGAVLLALQDMSAELKAEGPAARHPREGKSGVLETEQEFMAQEWPFQPGERKVKMHVAEPPGGINDNTGLMLCLHNWGGIYNQETYLQWCQAFAGRYNVVAVSVNYLQSGDTEPRVIGEKPYDHGYLQAMDCLRALWHIDRQLKDKGVTINPRRCYSMGGSGGGNVSLMANKLAPHTFACVVDICGMPGLTDGIAYGTGEYGSQLNAGYSRDPQSPAYLSRDLQQIRDPGDPEHLKVQYEANPRNKVVIVHGVEDQSCPVVHKVTIFRNMLAAGFRPDGHFVTARDVDGEVITTTGHAVGDRQKVVERYADAYLLEEGRLALQTEGPGDFERGSQVVYPTAGGRFVVDYSDGPPTVRFEGTEGQ